MLALYLSQVKSEDEKDKFEKIYLLYRGLMLSRAYDILRDRQLAEDAVHNAFLRILKNIKKLNDSQSPSTKSYVMVVLENVAKTMYAKRKKEKVYELSENIPEDFDVQRDTEIKLTAEAVAEKLTLLPDKYRDVLLLKFINGLNDKEIALSLGISDSAARKRLQRAREKLKALLGGQYG